MSRFEIMDHPLAAALDFEIECLSVGSEYLPACAIAVRDEHVESPEYWAWLIGQLDAAQSEAIASAIGWLEAFGIEFEVSL